MHFEESLQIIRPKLPPQQEWYRNKYHKNWGMHLPLLFKNGKPSFILPSLSHISFTVIYFIVLLLISTVLIKQKTIINIFLSILSILSYCWACTSGHGIASQSLPILNQSKFVQYKGYCEPCRNFTGKIGFTIQQQFYKQLHNLQTTQHCKVCRICYFQSYYHSNLLGICITKDNYWPFLCFNLFSIVNIMRIIVLYFQLI